MTGQSPDMQSGSAKPAHKIEQQELFAPEDTLNHHAEDVQGVHIEEYVPDTSVHKHVCNDLPPAEIGRCGIEEPESPYHEVLVDKSCYKYDQVDQDKIPGHRRYGRKETATSFLIIIRHLKSFFYLIGPQDRYDPAPV